MEDKGKEVGGDLYFSMTRSSITSHQVISQKQLHSTFLRCQTCESSADNHVRCGQFSD
jgi:hypothetical protein